MNLCNPSRMRGVYDRRQKGRKSQMSIPQRAIALAVAVYEQSDAAITPARHSRKKID
jgi:hypothetical protein